MKRNKGLIKKWIAALRGGKYHKTTGMLCRVVSGQSSHCCLGVACRVAIKNGIDIVVKNIGGSVEFDGNQSDLPIKLMKLFGVDGADQGNLIRMNDADRVSFRQIANYIEENIL